MNEPTPQKGYYAGPQHQYGDRPLQNTESPRGLVAGEAIQTIPSKPFIRQISIEPLDYGFIVRVGCQTMAIEDKGTLIGKLSEYINNPIETEIKYDEGKLF